MHLQMIKKINTFIILFKKAKRTMEENVLLKTRLGGPLLQIQNAGNPLRWGPCPWFDLLWSWHVNIYRWTSKIVGKWVSELVNKWMNAYIWDKDPYSRLMWNQENEGWWY